MIRKIYFGTCAVLLAFLACIPPYDSYTFFIGWMAILSVYEATRNEVY